MTQLTNLTTVILFSFLILFIFCFHCTTMIFSGNCSIAVSTVIFMKD